MSQGRQVGLDYEDHYKECEFKVYWKTIGKF